MGRLASGVDSKAVIPLGQPPFKHLAAQRGICYNDRMHGSMQRMRRSGRALLVFLLLSGAVLGLGGSAWRIATEGVGVLGVNNAVPWGWDVVSFVFWIGLGHAGTLISAVLLLTGQTWRRPIARHAELMTLCAVLTAAVFPLIHVGRMWVLWQMNPLPVASGVWPNPSSALVWDAAAIGSYFLLSLLYWLAGMLRERQDTPALRVCQRRVCFLMAAALTPLVITVHSVVGCDFALTLRWQSPLLPPFFVCGALLSGMAAVQLIALCRACGPEVLFRLARLTLGLAWAIGLFYALELLHEPRLMDVRYGGMLALNVLLPSLYAFPGWGRKRWLALLVSCGILVGMWLEREHIIIDRSLLAAGGSYQPSAVDVAMLLGSIGLFLGLFLTLSHRMPEEREPEEETPEVRIPGEKMTEEGESPAESTPPIPPRPGQCSLAGAGIGLALSAAWLLLTRESDTAGLLTGRPHGLPFDLPLLLVASLLGAGLAPFLYFIRRLHP